MLHAQPAGGAVRSPVTLVLPGLPLSLLPEPASGATGGAELPLLLPPLLLLLLLPPPLEPLPDPPLLLELDPLLEPELDPLLLPELDPLLEPELDPLLEPLPLLLPLICLSAVPLGVPQPVGPS